MSSTAKCQAAIPSKCRYHGADSLKHTELLKNKMIIATETYKALKNKDEAYMAYSIMREAQKEYYATTDGLLEIENVLNNPLLKSHQRDAIEAIYKTATEQRLSYEKSATAESAFAVPASLKPYLPLPEPNTNENNLESNLHNISAFSHEGKPVTIDYSIEKELILFSHTTSPEDSILIGRAKTIEEAERKATAWFNRQFNR